MKIVRENVAYIQKRDIANIIRDYTSSFDTSFIPESFFVEVYGVNEVFIMTEKSENEFVAFDKAESISFIKGLDLVDYDSARCLSIGELKKQIQEIVTEKNSIASTYNLLSAEEQNQRIDLLKRYKTLERKGRSLTDIYWAKCGKEKIVVPDGVEKIDAGKADAIKSLIKKLF